MEKKEIQKIDRKSKWWVPKHNTGPSCIINLSSSWYFKCFNFPKYVSDKKPEKKKKQKWKKETVTFQNIINWASMNSFERFKECHTSQKIPYFDKAIDTTSNKVLAIWRKCSTFGMRFLSKLHQINKLK